MVFFECTRAGKWDKMMTKASFAATEQDLDQLAALFRVLADRTRLQILLSLSESEKNVGTICQQLGLPQPTVSHHLALLRMHNVVAHRRDGKQVFYGIEGRIERTGDSLILPVQNLSVQISLK